MPQRPHVGRIRPERRRRRARLPRLLFVFVQLSSIRKSSSYRFIVAGLFDLQLIPPKAPSGPLPPLSGRGLFFLRSVSAAVLVGDEADHVFLIVDMSAVHSPGMGRARGLRRFPKREVRA
jgi:hypothetical protein